MRTLQLVPVKREWDHRRHLPMLLNDTLTSSRHRTGIVPPAPANPGPIREISGEGFDDKSGCSETVLLPLDRYRRSHCHFTGTPRFTSFEYTRTAMIIEIMSRGVPRPGCDQTFRALRYATLCCVSSHLCSTK